MLALLLLALGLERMKQKNRHASTYRTSVFGDGFDDNDPFDLERKDFFANVPAKKMIFLGTLKKFLSF